MTGFYEKLLEQHGDSPRSLDWSEAGQQERFRVLREVGIEGHESVLDVGCGLGHFLTYRLERQHNGPYFGVDRSPTMIEKARARFPWPDESFRERFHVVDVMCDSLPVADYVVASGVLNLVERSNFTDMQILLRKCFDACSVGAAVNMLSSRAPKKREGRFYYDPAWALAEALAITPYVTLRHDYRDNDLTLYLRRSPA